MYDQNYTRNNPSGNQGYNQIRQNPYLHNQNRPQQPSSKTEKKKSGAGKIIGIIVALLLAAGILVAAVLGIVIYGISRDPADKLIGLLDEGKYEEAIDYYADKYDNPSDIADITPLISSRIESIINGYKNGDIAVNKAKTELEAIAEMNIPTIDSEYLADAIASFQGDTAEEPTEEEQKTLPEATVPAKKPEIASAVTLEGEVLPSSNTNINRSFDADKAIDGIADTCWCVNTENEGGKGAEIRINLAEMSEVKGLKIINGNLYRPEEDIYLSNGQVKRFTVTFSDGTSETFTIPFNSTANREYISVPFSESVITDRIIITVDEAYVGAKYTTNVCIGEIDVY